MTPRRSTLLLAAIAALTTLPAAAASPRCPVPPYLDTLRSPWATSPSALESHSKLRAAAGVAMPDAASMIAIWGNSTHHSSSTFSIVATRGADGIWHVDWMGAEGPGLLQIPMKYEPVERFAVSSEKSKRIDAILADRCLFAEPTNFTSKDFPGVGFLSVGIDIRTPGRVRVASGIGHIPGLTGELWSLLG